MDDEWIYQSPFSYIHGRLMVLCMRDPVSIFRKAFGALEPGGYFEMQDFASPLCSADGTLDNTSLQTLYNLIVSGASKVGIDSSSAKRFKGMFEEVGFVDVREVVINVPIGPWAKDERHKMMGRLFLKDLDPGLEGIAMGLCTRVLGMTKEEVSDMAEKASLDMNNRDVHAYQPL
jgi:hypothetical protein